MTTTFLFWNTGKLQKTEILTRLVQRHSVDVLMLTECDFNDAELIEQLTRSTNHRYCRPWTQSDRIRIFTRIPEHNFREVQFDPTDRMTISKLIFEKTDMLLAVVHFPDKLNWSDDDQREETQRFAREIRSAERRQGHQRTVLVGDLNMNPFEPAMVSSHGFHGVMTRELAEQRSRIVQKCEYPFFYNPMWGFFGDRTAGPAGTHFYRTGKPVVYFWNIFDQVLVRPDLLNVFENEIRILSDDGTELLCDRLGRPSKVVASDHFPLLFRIRM